MYRRILPFLAVVAIAACDTATPTEAPGVKRSFDNNVVQHDRRVPISGTLTSPCNGETVTLDGYAHFRVTQETNPDGSTSFRQHVNTQHISGIGAVTGSKYNYIVVSNASGTQQNVTPFGYTQTVNQVIRLTASGKTPNFLAHVLVTDTYDGTTFTQEIKQNSAECK